jgi:two-component system NtrC family sensor kinase
MKLVNKSAHNLIVCLLILPWISISGFSQSVSVDSLKGILPTTKGSPRADLLLTISNKYRNSNQDSLIRYAREGKALSAQLKYARGEAESDRLLGWAERNPRQALDYYYSALSRFRSINDLRGMADVYNNLGVFWDSKNDSLSLFNYDSSLTLYRQINFKDGESAVLNYIGIVYQQMGNYQKAIDFTLKGLEVRKLTNDHPGVVWSYINAGNIYLAGSQYESALQLYLQSISYAREHGLQPYETALTQLGRTYLLLKQYGDAETYLLRPATRGYDPSRNYILLGQLYSETGKTDSAFMEYKKSLENSRKDNNREEEAESLIGLSKLYLKKNDGVLAMEYAKQAYSVGETIKNKQFLASAALLLAPLYEKAGNFKYSLQLFKLAHAVLDSISNETNENYQHKLAAFESKSQIEAGQAHVRLLSAEKELQEQKLDAEKLYKELILIACGIILLISFITIRNINRKRIQIQSQKDELQAAQSQLIQREKMASLGELTAGIAHEIQNPLNFVNNFSAVNVELIEELKEEHKKELRDIRYENEMLNDILSNEQKINHHGKRADSIVKGMLQHSRTSSGQKEPTNINSLTDEYMRMSYHGLRAKDKSFNVTMITDFDERAALVNIVPQDIGRVLLNLFNNSFYSVNEKQKLKATGYEPTVWVSTKQLGKNMEIRIRDNGMGVPQKILDKIFQPFFTTKPTGEGTGLGLSISYEIITKGHAGQLKMESAEGEFVECIIILPLTQ